MRIWIDALTPKQALFTMPIVQELGKLNHVVYVTSRHYREPEALFKRANFDVFFVGKHGGGSLGEKLFASSERVHKLAELVSRWEPELAVHFASPECARVAFGLKITQVCITDSPHAESVMKLTIPLIEHLVTPWIIPYDAWKNYGLARNRITRYKALDPAAWLKRDKLGQINIANLGGDESKRTVMVRSEESYAAYLSGADKEWGDRIIEALLSKFSDINLVVLCRYPEQVQVVAEKYGAKVIVPKEVVDGPSLINSSDLFIGMGGTMTTEAALLGIPTISAYQGGTLYTERFLTRQGLLVKTRNVNHLLRATETLLSEERTRQQIRHRAEILLSRMEDPVQTVMSVVQSFKK